MRASLVATAIAELRRPCHRPIGACGGPEPVDAGRSQSRHHPCARRVTARPAAGLPHARTESFLRIPTVCREPAGTATTSLQLATARSSAPGGPAAKTPPPSTTARESRRAAARGTHWPLTGRSPAGSASQRQRPVIGLSHRTTLALLPWSPRGRAPRASRCPSRTALGALPRRTEARTLQG